MTDRSEKSLKAQYMKWLVTLATADLVVALLLLGPAVLQAPWTRGDIARLVLMTVIPVGVLLVVNVLPHDVKSMLVYWKPRGVLPGCEAFTKYAKSDPRIDLRSLERHVGQFPTDPAEQNAKWYRLYKEVNDEGEVVEAQRMFLMYRDMAVLSLALAVIVPLGILATPVRGAAPWVAAGALVAQYFLTAVSARWSGVRFVCNVLAIHSAKKPGPKRK